MNHVALFQMQKEQLLKDHIRACGPVDPVIWEEAMIKHYYRMDYMNELHEQYKQKQLQELDESEESSNEEQTTTEVENFDRHQA